MAYSARALHLNRTKTPLRRLSDRRPVRRSTQRGLNTARGLENLSRPPATRIDLLVIQRAHSAACTAQPKKRSQHVWPRSPSNCANSFDRRGKNARPARRCRRPEELVADIVEQHPGISTRVNDEDSLDWDLSPDDGQTNRGCIWACTFRRPTNSVRIARPGSATSINRSWHVAVKAMPPRSDDGVSRRQHLGGPASQQSARRDKLPGMLKKAGGLKFFPSSPGLVSEPEHRRQPPRRRIGH